MTSLDVYAKKLAHLNANKNKKHWTVLTAHCAPHKPLLLLAIIDLIEQGAINRNFIELTDDLIELFGIFWHVVNPPSQRADFFKPFFHLHSEGFWHLVPVPGAEDRLAHIRTMVSMAQLKETVLGAKLDDQLFTILLTEDGRFRLRHTLITTYFAPELQGNLLKQTEINVAAFEYSEVLLADARQEYETANTKAKEQETAVRDQGFRRAIVKVYDHRCAICGIRIVTADGHTAIAAAHIVPWSKSYNDDPRNGLALCHLCHWTFDEGLVTFLDNYLVKTSPQLSLTPNLPGHLLTFTGRKLIGPSDDDFWPFLDSIRWHRKNMFRSR